MAQGIITLGNREGNGFADKLARDGVDEHSVGLVALSYAYVMRENLYCDLLGTIHKMILRVLKSDHDLREQSATRAWATGSKKASVKPVVLDRSIV